jgi:hypothetical protein
MNMQNKIYWVFAALLALALACGPSTPQQEDSSAFNTAVAQTAQVQFVQMTLQAESSPVATAVAQPTAPQPTAIPPTAVPPTAPPPTVPPPDVFAPDPLGPAWSSMAFSGGTCYDMDVLFTANDASVDVCLDNNGVLLPRNGATFSGQATLAAPSLYQCRAAALTADPLAPLTDLYLCFKTNLGSYGFFVMRDDQMLASGYIVFDAYIFP